jgi:hypothetical protein
MKRTFIMIILCFLANNLYAQRDTVFVKINKDTIRVWNINLYENCGSKFKFEILYMKDTITITEVDTSTLWYKCDCLFNVNTVITGIPGGKYLVKVYRKYVLHPKDTAKFVGLAHFEYSPVDNSAYFMNGFQSICLNNMAVKELKETKDPSLLGNYPNPFNSTTQIKYSLNFESNVVLDIYDLTGRKVSTLVNEKQKPGNYVKTFNPLNLTTGMYIYRLRTAEGQVEKKMLMLK